MWDPNAPPQGTLINIPTETSKKETYRNPTYSYIPPEQGAPQVAPPKKSSWTYEDFEALERAKIFGTNLAFRPQSTYQTPSEPRPSGRGSRR